MKSPTERLNDRLGRWERHPWPGNGLPGRPSFPTEALHADAEVDELVTAARRLQASPQLQADPQFARLLEARLLQRHASLQKTHAKRRWFFPRLLGPQRALATAIALCLLIFLFGTGVLAVAAQVSNPENPLYTLKNWEQQVQVSMAGSPESRASLDVQFAREKLGTLAQLAGPAHVQAYRQALADFDQQVSIAAGAIRNITSQAERTRLSSELASLEGDARYTLRGLLPQLPLAERLLTTEELGRLGDTVPRLRSVEVVLPAHPGEQATIIITGDDLQPGVQLLVNGQPVDAQSAWQNGSYIFTADWNGEPRTQSIGILNPDGTLAQTAAITLKSTTGTGNGNNGNGNNGQHGNGKKPGKTPTPHH